MSREKPIALVDMDGTLCDFDTAMKRDYEKLKAPGEPDVSPFDETIPWVKARRDLIKSQKNWWLNLEKFKLGFDVYQVLLDLGYKTHVLTRGPGHAPQAW